MDFLERRLRAYYGRLDERSGESVVESAFVTEHQGRTVITAPATSYLQPEVASTNGYMRWIAGRLVGGEKANRNGAIWTSGELQFGLPTVAHGPLNWLHEGRHVIGAIASARLVADDPQVPQPHIVSTAALWRWLYPDEATVVEMASASNSLWLSMECVARSMACVGTGGCGQSFPYGQVMRDQASACEHIRNRSAERRMVDPTFLGAALIVPPVKPGWAEADARVLEKAAVLAPQTYVQAGSPDVSAAAWEQLMAQVVRFHEGR
jgi:hypothetical protein